MALSLPNVCGVLLGLPGGLIGSVFSKQKNREVKLKYLKKSFINNNIVCLQEVHGKDENLQAIQVLAPRFRIFGTFFPENENAGGSAVCIHKDLVPEEAIVTHFSYVSRPRSYCPHTIWETKLSDRQRPFLNLNLHCGNYVAGCILFTRTGLHIPMEWALFLGDFNSCDPERGRFNVWNQTFTDGDPRKTAMLHSFFNMFLRLLNLISRRGTPQPLRSYALCQGLIVLKTIYLWVKHGMSTVTLTSSRTWKVGPFRVIMQQYASSIKSQQIEDTRANEFPAGCPKIPFSVSLLQRVHGDHRFSTDPFGALAEFKAHDS